MDTVTEKVIARAALMAAAGISILVGTGFYAAHLAQPSEETVCIDLATMIVVDPSYCEE